jgi:ethanolamine permease
VSGVLGVIAWFAIGLVWFAAAGRRRLVLAPEEAFAHKAIGAARARAR